MEERTVESLDREDVELAETLRSLGTRKAEAYLMTYLDRAGPSVSRSVEVGTSLRQPEVSMAAKALSEKGWLEREVADEEGEHRPMKRMRLTVDLTEVVDSLERVKEEKFREKLRLVDRARDLIQGD